MNLKINKVLIYKIFICFIFILVITLNVVCIFGASEPELVKKVNTALTNIKKWLVKLATPAAGVAIATGVLMRKFSFGDEEKMVKGKKVIVNAFVCYAIVISIDIIIKFIEAVI